MSKTSEALEDREHYEELKACLNKNVFSICLKVGREKESTMSAVNEFQTAGAEQRKAWSAKFVLVVGLQTCGIAEERSRRVTMRGWM